MKSASFATLILLLLTAAVVAQENNASSNPPDLIVLEKSWSKRPLSPGIRSNPLGPNEALIEQTRIEKAAIRQRDYSLPNQPTEARMPVPASRPIPPAASAFPSYVYKLKVQNNGTKTIKSVDWEYQFLDPQTLQLMGYRRIKSDAKLSPGKVKVLEKRFTRQPTLLVNVNSLGKKYQDQFTERVIIHRIEYSDGSVWVR